MFQHEPFVSKICFDPTENELSQVAFSKSLSKIHELVTNVVGANIGSDRVWLRDLLLILVRVLAVDLGAVHPFSESIEADMNKYLAESIALPPKFRCFQISWKWSLADLKIS